MRLKLVKRMGYVFTRNDRETQQTVLSLIQIMFAIKLLRSEDGRDAISSTLIRGN